MNSSLDQAELLNEPVQPSELAELLERLAAADALFAEPVPTIRDVAEATDASPLLIGRILSQMRGPDEVAVLQGRIDGFEARLRELEAGRHDVLGRAKSAHKGIPEGFEKIDFNELFRNAGVADFEPEASWTSQKGLLNRPNPSEWFAWHTPEPSHRIARFVVFGFLILLMVMMLTSPSGCPLSRSG